MWLSYFSYHFSLQRIDDFLSYFLSLLVTRSPFLRVAVLGLRSMDSLWHKKSGLVSGMLADVYTKRSLLRLRSHICGEGCLIDFVDVSRFLYMLNALLNSLRCLVLHQPKHRDWNNGEDEHFNGSLVIWLLLLDSEL